jgi:hypothetical protein
MPESHLSRRVSDQTATPSAGLKVSLTRPMYRS